MNDVAELLSQINKLQARVDNHEAILRMIHAQLKRLFVSAEVNTKALELISSLLNVGVDHPAPVN